MNEDLSDFDPLRFMAKQQHSLTETLLEDILRTEKSRALAQTLGSIHDGTLKLDSLVLSSPDAAQYDSADLLDILASLHSARGPDMLCLMLGLRNNPELAESPVIQELSSEAMSEWDCGFQ